MTQLEKLKLKWTPEKALYAIPADHKHLLSFQQNNNILIPDDLVKYFTLLNGTGGDYTNDLFYFYSIDRINKVKEEFKDWVGNAPNYRELLKVDNISELYVFANYQFNLFAYAIKLYPEFSTENEVYVLSGEEYKKIANSFSEFIELYLNDSAELYFSNERDI